MLEEKNDSLILPKEKVKIHIDSNENLTLKELSQILELINMALNDINREGGIRSNSVLGREYATEVEGVESGSIILHVLTNFVAPVTLSILSNFLYDKLIRIGRKNGKKEIELESVNPISVSINGNDNMINIVFTK